MLFGDRDGNCTGGAAAQVVVPRDGPSGGDLGGGGGVVSVLIRFNLAAHRLGGEQDAVGHGDVGSEDGSEEEGRDGENVLVCFRGSETNCLRASNVPVPAARRVNCSGPQ